MPKVIQGKEFSINLTKVPVGGGVEVILIKDEIDNPGDWLSALTHDLAWVRMGSTPRDEYFASDIGKPYTYGAGAGVRTYVSQPFTSPLRYLQQQAQFWTRLWGDQKALEVVFLNKYNDGRDHLGWHADNSPEMDDTRPIVITSFGAEREIWFRENPSTDILSTETKPITKVLLPNGSMCIMPPGMQDTHQHRIPKSDRVDCGPRVSLTFRGYVDV